MQRKKQESCKLKQKTIQEVKIRDDKIGSNRATHVNQERIGCASNFGLKNEEISELSRIILAIEHLQHLPTY